MRGLIGIVQIGHPGPDEEGDHYWTAGPGASLAAMYGGLLGMRHVFVGYHKLIHEDERTPEIGFEHAPRDQPPRWRDPDHPQQVHLDIGVRDLDRAEALALSRGATKLEEMADHRVLPMRSAIPSASTRMPALERAMITVRPGGSSVSCSTASAPARSRRSTGSSSTWGRGCSTPPTASSSPVTVVA
jgi:hypothetical protein